jgi:hypothetical protein
MGRFSRPAPIAPLTIGSLLTNLQELTMHDEIEASALHAWPACSLTSLYMLAQLDLCHSTICLALERDNMRLVSQRVAV